MWEGRPTDGIFAFLFFLSGRGLFKDVLGGADANIYQPGHYIFL